MSEPSYSQSESGVRSAIKDVSNSENLFKTLHEFSRRLTTMHRELVNKEGPYLVSHSEADRITADYCENFIWTVLRTLEKSREAERLSDEHQTPRKLAQGHPNPEMEK